MRWEEIWDISLRIQNLFLTGVFPERLSLEIEKEVQEQFCDIPLAIRSSAPDEDNTIRSFACLHASYLNVVGLDELLIMTTFISAGLTRNYGGQRLLQGVDYKAVGLKLQQQQQSVICLHFCEEVIFWKRICMDLLPPAKMLIHAESMHDNSSVNRPAEVLLN